MIHMLKYSTPLIGGINLEGRDMDYKPWVKLLGQTTEEEKVRDALAKAGFEKVPVIGKEGLDEKEDVDGLTLTFSDPDSDVGDGIGVLSGVSMILKEYSGPLPFKLKRTDSRDALHARFGDPDEEDEDFLMDSWEVDELVLSVLYKEDLDSLKSVGVMLPEPD